MAISEPMQSGGRLYRVTRRVREDGSEGDAAEALRVQLDLLLVLTESDAERIDEDTGEDEPVV